MTPVMTPALRQALIDVIKSMPAMRNPALIEGDGPASGAMAAASPGRFVDAETEAPVPGVAVARGGPRHGSAVTDPLSAMMAPAATPEAFPEPWSAKVGRDYIAPALSSAFDPLGIPSAVMGLFDPDRRDEWRAAQRGGKTVDLPLLGEQSIGGMLGSVAGGGPAWMAATKLAHKAAGPLAAVLTGAGSNAASDFIDAAGGDTGAINAGTALKAGLGTLGTPVAVAARPITDPMSAALRSGASMVRDNAAPLAGTAGLGALGMTGYLAATADDAEAQQTKGKKGVAAPAPTPAPPPVVDKSGGTVMDLSVPPHLAGNAELNAIDEQIRAANAAYEVARRDAAGQSNRATREAQERARLALDNLMARRIDAITRLSASKEPFDRKFGPLAESLPMLALAAPAIFGYGAKRSVNAIRNSALDPWERAIGEARAALKPAPGMFGQTRPPDLNEAMLKIKTATAFGDEAAAGRIPPAYGSVLDNVGTGLGGGIIGIELANLAHNYNASNTPVGSPAYEEAKKRFEDPMTTFARPALFGAIAALTGGHLGRAARSTVPLEAQTRGLASMVDPTRRADYATLIENMLAGEAGATAIPGARTISPTSGTIGAVKPPTLTVTPTPEPPTNVLPPPVQPERRPGVFYKDSDEARKIVQSHVAKTLKANQPVDAIAIADAVLAAGVSAPTRQTIIDNIRGYLAPIEKQIADGKISKKAAIDAILSGVTKLAIPGGVALNSMADVFKYHHSHDQPRSADGTFK